VNTQTRIAQNHYMYVSSWKLLCIHTYPEKILGEQYKPLYEIQVAGTNDMISLSIVLSITNSSCKKEGGGGHVYSI